MAVSLSANPTHSYTLNFFVLVLVSISVFSLLDICDARSSLDKFKLRAGSKVSYSYNSEADALDNLDLPTLDAYDFSFLSPSPLAQTPTNLISNPPSNSPSPSPSPNGASPTSGPSSPFKRTGAPRHSWVPDYAVWCVARPTVPEAMLQRAMDYACGNGADCGSVRPNGPCFVPNSLAAHASYVFNSYWQRTKVAGGTCDFGGTAMLITVDPSFKGCQFIYM